MQLTVEDTLIILPEGMCYERRYCSSSTSSLSHTPATQPSRWSAEPTPISTSQRYRFVSERQSTDGGETWGAWCSAQIDAYLSEDGKSISVKGSAKGIISGNQGPENIVASPAEDDVVLDNTSYPSGNIRIYRNGSWIAGAAEDNTAYITVSDGHLWVATGSNLAGKKWTDCGQVKGDTGQTGYSIVASLTRNNFTEEQWETYDKERRDGSHTESWTYERINADGTNNGIYTSAIRNNCRIGDFFIIAGTATDTGNSHRLTYKSTTDAGNLVGYCVSHEIARAGTDAVVYQLCPMPGIVNFQRNALGEWKSNSIRVICSYRITAGSAVTTVDYSSANDSEPYLYRRYKKEDGTFTDWVKSSSVSVGTGITHAFLEFCLSMASNAEDVAESNIIVSTDVPILRDGSPGAKGSTGRMGYPAGEHNKDINYTRSATATPIVHLKVTGSTNEYWFLDADESGSGDGSVPSDSSTVWKPASYYGLVISEMLFTMFAKLGGWIVAGDFFISQYGTLIDANGTETVIGMTNATTPFSGRVAYAWFDGNDPMAHTLPSRGYYKFRPMKVMNAVTGEEWMAGGNVHIKTDGSVEMENALIRGSLMCHKVYRTLPGRSINLFSLDLAGNFALLGDIILLHGNYASDCVLRLPPAKFFPGARVKIINGTYHSASGYLDGEPSIVTLDVFHSSETEPVVEDSFNVAVNSLAVAAPFVRAGASTMSYYDYYGELTFDSYTSVELVSTLNWYQNPNNPQYYVWMVVAAR